MATLSWDLVGGNPAPGDRAVYRELSHDLAATAQSADRALRMLNHFSRSCDESVWKGEAADAFRGKIRELPPKLQKLHRSYDTASRSMAGYGAVLDELQPRAHNLLERAHEARRDEVVQKGNRDRAREQAPDSGFLSFLSTPATPYDQAVEDAQNRQREINRQIDRLRDERKGAEKKAVAGLERAESQAVKGDSWIEKRLHGIDKWVDKHAGVLKKISGALKIVSAVAGVLSFIPVLNFITAPIALATGGAALAIDGTLVATGNGNWKALAVDAALMALPGVGRLVGRGLRSGAPQLMGQLEGAIAGSRAMAAVSRVGASKTGRILAAPGRGLNRVNDVIAEGLGRTAVGRSIVRGSERAAARAQHVALARVEDQMADYRMSKGFTGQAGAPGSDTVARVDVGGQPHHGSNSSASADWNTWRRKKFDEVRQITGRPLNANPNQAQWPYHAEFNALARAHDASGGKLPKMLTMHVDKVSCSNCLGGLRIAMKAYGVDELQIYQLGVDAPKRLFSKGSQ